MNYALSNGIIDLPQVKQQIEMSKREERLKAHPYRIWQGKDGKWRTYMPDKNRGRVLKVLTSREDLEDYIVDYVRQMEKSPFVREVFSEWNDRRLELSQISKSTYARNITCFRRHFEVFGEKRIQAVGIYDWCDFLEEQVSKHELKAKGFSNLKGIAKGIIQRAKRTGLIDYTSDAVFAEINDSELNFKKTKKKDRDDVFDEYEAGILKKYLLNHQDPKNLVLLLLFSTGMRIGEAVSLKHEDLEQCTIYINRTETEYRLDGKIHHEVKEYPKTEAGDRVVVVPTNSEWLIKKINHIAPFEEYVFMENGKRINAPQVRKRLKKVCREVDIPYRSTHKIRKTYVSILLDNNCDERFILKQVGHTDIRTSEQCYHRDRKNVAAKQQILDGIAELAGC